MNKVGNMNKVTFPNACQLMRWHFHPMGFEGSMDAPGSMVARLFDRASGRVDPDVAAYWREHYDIAHRLQTQWAALKPDLDGKIRVIVGDADTFYLDGAARRLKAVLDGVGAKAEVRFLPGKTHSDLYAEGDDRRALLQTELQLLICVLLLRFHYCYRLFLLHL